MKKLMMLGGLSYLIPAIKTAHAHGYHVITVDYLPDNIAHKYSDEYYNISTFDKEKILDVARRIEIDGILSFAVDAGVVSAAYVAEQMGLPFQCSFDSTCILQDKSLFREFLARNGFNTPKARGYNNVDDALNDIDYYSWPVIVKPVDSCGSKGVQKVDTPELLKEAIEQAIEFSHSGSFIVEDFLELQGYQSSADCFSVDGELVYADYSDQLFDKGAENPYTPAIEIWPASMPQEHQDYLTSEIQRLLKLLNCGTGLYNIESRVCKNGKPYIMEVSPRAGGNRIAELQRIGTGIDLIEAEVCKAVGDDIKSIDMPHYEGCFVNYIVHSNKDGIFEEVVIDEDFKKKHVIEADIRVKQGDHVGTFKGANNAIGTLFLHFDTREELDEALGNQHEWLQVKV
ncbi:MAG: ATP-grasp domain-containing protein [Bacteroidaceae bacterium]|nr:ATP-grasp domain-containing protein [Bacteroidaceae bacterium]